MIRAGHHGRRFACLILLILAFPASAHRLSPAFLGLTETQPNLYEVQWKVSVPGGLADALEPRIPDGCTVEGQVRTYLVDDARIQHGVIACTDGIAGHTMEIIGLPSTDTDVLLRVGHLDGSSFTYRLVPEAPSVVVPERAGPLEVMRAYLVIGVEHILFGIDHLLFVFALLLLVRGVGRLIATVTAFTVAHSITLGAASLGFVSVPSAPVEAVIALSILFLATELARRGPACARAGDDLTARFPWLVAFSFGLLHGFGFAGALSEVGLPEQAIPLALLFFNVGVEVGQLIFIAAVLALAWAWRRSAAPAPRWWPRVAAYGIGSVAAFWAIERTVSVF